MSADHHTPDHQDAGRRHFLIAAAASSLLGLHSAGEASAAEAGLKLGEPAPFSFDHVKEEAQALLGKPYQAPLQPSAAILDKIDYDAWGKIAFNTDLALFGSSQFPITFFHLGRFFQSPIDVYAVESGSARKVIYEERYFTMPADSPARALQRGAGFAGFRIQEPREGVLDWRKNDWVAFLGASYFRAIGALYQYGLSARGVAIDTAVSDATEEFPSFTKIYIENPASTDGEVVLFALLEGPSIVGAVKFSMTRGKGVVMDIEQTLFLRRSVKRFGIAPLTSMYWFSETAKPTAIDWRPEIHDSDGLAIWTGRGERLWRPLNNPPRVMASAFGDENPKGFGLLQRDRLFDHYLDGVNYDKRPSLWVEPKGEWGRGAVQLIELPTDDEIHDNIVAAWVPERPVTAGSRLDLHYSLYWLADEPYPSDLARVVATRLGNGGQPGVARSPGVRKFLIEFLGGPLRTVPFGVTPKLSVQTSRGHVTDYQLVEPVPDGVAGHWRAQFDLADATGVEPVELRAQLTLDGRVITETWLYQYHPF